MSLKDEFYEYNKQLELKKVFINKFYELRELIEADTQDRIAALLENELAKNEEEAEQFLQQMHKTAVAFQETLAYFRALDATEMEDKKARIQRASDDWWFLFLVLIWLPQNQSQNQGSFLVEFIDRAIAKNRENLAEKARLAKESETWKPSDFGM